MPSISRVTEKRPSHGRSLLVTLEPAGAADADFCLRGRPGLRAPSDFALVVVAGVVVVDVFPVVETGADAGAGVEVFDPTFALGVLVLLERRASPEAVDVSASASGVSSGVGWISSPGWALRA